MNDRTQTHDYTKRTWGHDYTTLSVIDGGKRLRLSGWGRGIEAGDYLLLQNDGGSTRYQVESIEYRMDPPDMWFAEVRFAPRPHVSSCGCRDCDVRRNQGLLPMRRLWA